MIHPFRQSGFFRDDCAPVTFLRSSRTPRAWRWKRFSKRHAAGSPCWNPPVQRMRRLLLRPPCGGQLAGDALARLSCQAHQVSLAWMLLRLTSLNIRYWIPALMTLGPGLNGRVPFTP